MKFFGITGTNGKTTTAWILAEFKVWYYETAEKEGLAMLSDINATLERYRRETGRDFYL